MNDKNMPAEKIVLKVMQHFGLRRNYQVAEYFEVTPQTLSGWIKSGEIPPKHLMKFNKDISENQKEAKFTNLNESLYLNNEIEIKKKLML